VHAVLDLSHDIRTLSGFKRNTVHFLRQLKQTGEPIFLTRKGKAELVLLDADSYLRVRQALDHLETLEGIREGLEDMKAGRTLCLEEARKEVAKKFAARA
jgi:PHD/YefM family antitoxin component YafN of YafNO toxin-antitoxin module